MKKAIIPLLLSWSTVAIADDREDQRQLFLTAQSELVETIAKLRSCSFVGHVSTEMVQWMVEAKRVLAHDLIQSNHDWTDEGLPVCGMTAQNPEADIRLSYSACQREVRSLPQAAKVLLRATALHLGKRDQAEDIADAIWDQGGSCNEGARLVAGGLHSCLMYRGEVTCWGGDQGQTEVPPLHQPMSLSAGHLHACAVDAYGTRCWGHTGYGENDVPGLWGTTQVSAGENSACALDDDGAKCWGFRAHYLAEPPVFQQPIQIANAMRHACVLDGGDVGCWGDDYQNADDSPGFTNATQIAVADGASCALENGQIKCWGGIEADPMPRRRNITNFDIGGSAHSGYHGCAIFENRAQCFGTQGDGATTVPQLIRPRQIVTNRFHTCALDDVGVKCWGSNQYGQIDVPAELQVLR